MQHLIQDVIALESRSINRALTEVKGSEPRWKNGKEMILIISTVVVIALLIAVLAGFLFAIGVLLNRIADNLDDCLQNVQKIAGQAEAILPGVGRINQTGGVVAGAPPLLIEGAEGVAAKLTPPKEAALNGASAVPAGVGYLD